MYDSDEGSTLRGIFLTGVIAFCYILAAKNPDACVGDESRINKVKRIFFFTAPKKEGFFFV